LPPPGRSRAPGIAEERTMDFDIPAELTRYLTELDEFIEREIRPLEEADDNIRFFDYRREDARTDWDRGGPTRPGTTGTRSRPSTAAGTAPIWVWRSSASTSPARAWACTATCRTST
jgi:hypothetical protein